MNNDIELEIKHLGKEFNVENSDKKLQVLKDINFTVNKGDFVCIVGGSGCGKSTLLRIIANLETPDSGSIVLNTEKNTENKKEVGFVFQENRLLPWLNVEENVMFGIFEKCSKKQKKEMAYEYLKLVGLEEYSKMLPQQLSGGMKQRVNIARTLIGRPEILLLDEPFSALDAFTKISLQEELIKIWEKNRTTMIMVTHDIEEAVYLGNKVLVMSAKPGVVKKIHDIRLSRPRFRTDENFVYYRNKIYEDFFEKRDRIEDYAI